MDFRHNVRRQGKRLLPRLEEPLRVRVSLPLHGERPSCRLLNMLMSQDVLSKLQSEFEDQMSKKRAIEENAARTRNRMEQVMTMAISYAPRFHGTLRDSCTT